MDCVFCKIINNGVPAIKVYEDASFLAFLDIRPLNPGHTLLVPKKHVQWVDDYEPFGPYWETARKISLAIKKAFNPMVVSYIVFGLGVSHAHIHVIPKFDNDGHMDGMDSSLVRKLSKEEMEEAGRKIREAINNV